MLKQLTIFGTVLSLALIATNVHASHSWGNYHWARTANPFTLQLGDNVSSAWDGYLGTASSDWSLSDVLDTSVVTGKTTARKCKPSAGRVEICNEKYGANGWLGIAQIWASGDHITQGIVKMNDTYFTTKTYNTPAWRQMVMCQEIGHTLGLDHQDEAFDNPNLGTCMDYTSDPSANQHPNAHDHEELDSIYGHFDAITTVLSSADGSGTGGHGGKPALVGKDIDLNNPSAWGVLVRESAQHNTAVYRKNLDDGTELFTFVTWADERRSEH